MDEPPPAALAPIAEQESDGSSHVTPYPSEEMIRAQGVVPPDDSMLEVRAVPAEAVDDGPSPMPRSPQSPRRLTFPITPFYSGKKSGCSKCSMWLALLFVLFLMLSIALFIVWAVTSDGFRNLGPLPDVCSSKECIHTAFRLSSYMDERVEACDNFYRHVCGKFHAQDADLQLNFLDQQKEKTARDVYGLLVAEDDGKTKSARFSKTLFASCMDGPARIKAGGYPLLNLLQNLPCGPIMVGCNFSSENYNWERHNGVVDWYAGIFPLVVYGRNVDQSDRTKLVLQLSPPDLEPLLKPLRDELYQLVRPRPGEMDALLQLSIRQNLLNDFVSRQLMRDPKEVEDQLDEVSLFMVELSRISRSITISQNMTYMSIAQLTNSVQINFIDMFNAYLSNVYKWSENDMVAIENMDYFYSLSALLQTTSPRTIANYLVSVTGLNLKRYSYDANTVFNNRNSSDPSWRDCVADLSGIEAVQKLYIKSQPSFTPHKTQKYLEQLKKDFLNTHRLYAPQLLADINRMGFLVGFPGRMTNEDMIWRPLSGLNLNQTDYFTSVTTTWKAQRGNELSQLGGNLDKDDAPFYPVLLPTIVYEKQLTTLIYPLSFLQEPITSPDENVPWYTIYGTLGVATQQMISTIFWSRADQRQAQQCFDNTYRSFLNPSFRTSLVITSDLSYTIQLADGFKTAMYGYTQWQTQHHGAEEKKLPGYEELDNDQSAMVTFGTLFCNTEGEAQGSEYEAMINTVMANTKLFSMHFQCTNSSSLYNTRSCV